MGTRRCVRDTAVSDQDPGPSQREEESPPEDSHPSHCPPGGTLFNALMSYVYAAGGPGSLDPFALLDVLALRMGATRAERQAAHRALEALAALRALLATGGLGPHLRDLINAAPRLRPHPGLVVTREFRYLEP